MSDETPFHPLLKCFALRIAYDFAKREGSVECDYGGCTDMAGAIKFFVMLDPHAKLIRTWSDNKPDTFYARTADTFRWFSISPYPQVGCPCNGEVIEGDKLCIKCWKRSKAYYFEPPPGHPALTEGGDS
jgi:hypothetical protein